MKLETTVVLGENAVARQYSWLQSALSHPPTTEAERKDFLARGLAAFREDAQAIANQAFNKGVEFAHRNPREST